jgi:hypothetical protein
MLRRAGRALVLAGMGFTLLAFPIGSSGAGAPPSSNTWSGKWERKEVPGTYLYLEERGGLVYGHYTWNDASGHLTCKKVAQDYCAGKFDERHYYGHFSLRLEGLSFTGTYFATNKDTNASGPGPFNGECVDGPCEGNIDFRFSASANHPPTVKSPLGTIHGWTVKAGGSESASAAFSHLTYVDAPGDINERDVFVDLKVEHKRLRKTGEVSVLTLSVGITNIRTHFIGGKGRFPDCPEGTAGQIVLTNDDRLLPGADLERTHDRVSVVMRDRNCAYLNHTFTNANSPLVTPSVGGPPGSSAGRTGGGQWAVVKLMD